MVTVSGWGVDLIYIVPSLPWTKTIVVSKKYHSFFCWNQETWESIRFTFLPLLGQVALITKKGQAITLRSTDGHQPQGDLLWTFHTFFHVFLTAGIFVFCTFFFSVEWVEHFWKVPEVWKIWWAQKVGELWNQKRTSWSKNYRMLKGGVSKGRG